MTEQTTASGSATFPEPNPKLHYFWGTGRRKRSVARVRVRAGEGKFEINKKPLDKYFNEEKDRLDAVAPLKATETFGKVDVFVNVQGGGTSGQAGAIVLGVARALKKANREYDDVLRAGGYLTRDSRMVERKKYGRRGARRSFQFSKR
ncbi:MAG: 30S ribosomal protein S9 [Planctomycetota bacterium]|nr:MAG: 30S ribosomal protein S9 [Planctomycetota bacterium]